RMSFPKDRHRIYRQLSFGAYADVFMTDERQYRTGDNDGQPRRMLGDAQMAWLINALKTSKATWKLVANEVCMARLNKIAPGVTADDWDGYPEDRATLLGAIEAAGIDNVVMLTGDAHVFLCSLLSSDFDTFGDGSSRKPAAVEYLAGSVTSAGPVQTEADVRARDPWIQQFNSSAHGYARLAIGPDQLVCDYLASDTANPGAPTGLLERFTQPAGTNRVQRESHASARV